ncbi:uncharacterized protein NPIL_147041 [Nephila pilipes]|uniref:Uncharacterized protein n=1 Tax=Nephila pilipes TaxID=299642 RepID=A0A8X6N829_NEPPI|nr:uncharacterized protein NPIL_147041 [Nephila pilipes]
MKNPLVINNGNEKEYCETVNKNFNANTTASVLKGLGIRDDPVVHERDQAMEIFKETVEFENGHYIVQLPFRKSYNELSDNYSLAKQRFQGLWRRFGHDSELYQQYREITLDYSEQGIIEEVKTETTDNELKRPVYHLPHQAEKENFDVHPVHETVSLGANETKVLGLSWNSHEDYLTTDTKSLLEFVSLDKNTKRFILQAVDSSTTVGISLRWLAP